MKKTKFMTRVIAVVFALAILFAMSVPALAANTAGENTYKGNANTSVFDTTNNTITLSKSVVFFNADNKTVYEPNITYTYTVSPVTVADSTTITDATPQTVHVKSGVTGVFTNNTDTATIVFSSANQAAASSTGTEKEKTTTIGFVPNNFPAAGVYRYKISESINLTAVTDAGLTARGNDYSADRYLDVYIRNSTAANAQPGDKEMYGAVIFKTTKPTTAQNNEQTSGQDSITTDTEKTTGFEPGGDPSAQGGTQTDYSYENDGTVDRYTTYNVTVTKTVNGSLGDKTHQFPFSFSIANSIAGAQYSYVKGTGTAVNPNPVASGGTSAVNTDYSAALTLADGESFTVYGVPSNQTTGSEVAITVSEKNTTPDTYTVAIVESSNILTPTDATLAANATATQKAATVIKASATKSIDFTNRLDELSPTGLAFRVAPYVLMLAAGVSLIVLFAKRRREVTDMI